MDIDTSQYVSKDDVDTELSETSTNPVQNNVIFNTFNQIASEFGLAIDQKQSVISDLETIRDGAAKGATALQAKDVADFVTAEDLAKVSTSGSYNDLQDKPTIPSAINIAGTNYTPSSSGIIDLNQAGLYSKPSTGIPNSDLSEELREKLNTAYINAEAYKGTVTNIKINGVTKSPADGVVDLGNLGTYSKPSTGIPKSDLNTSVQTSLGKADTAVQPGDLKGEVYIADFTMDSLKGGIYNGTNVECDVQRLVDEMNANKIILVREGEDLSYKGVYVLNGYAEDLLYFSIVDTSGNIFWCEGTDYISLQYIDAQSLRIQSWDSKQDTLTSGENIKTINGASILGSGNIEISGNSGTITGVSANGTSIATSGVANIPAATTSKYGVTKLSSATNSTSTSLAATASAVKSAYDLANGRQAKLVSGTNIKTINNTSILGSGNIAIDANIQAVDTSETLDDVNTNTYVKYVAQTLTEEQKAQVRENIGVSDAGGSTSKPIIVVNTDEYSMNFSGIKHMTPNVIYVVTNPLEGMILEDADFGDDLWYGIQYNSGDVYAEYSVVFTAREDCSFTFPSYIL